MNRAPQRILLGVGALALLALAASIAWREPSPGPLAKAHAAVPDLSDCEACHAEEGLDAGCLGCHAEIASQRKEGRGLHAGFEAACATCHPDHLGADFDLRGPVAWKGEKAADFGHSHVQFALDGKHDALSCEKCHDPAPRLLLSAFPGHPRSGSFLGASQACDSCHEDPHEGFLGKECAACHTQEAFRPAIGFRHEERFPLRGAHAEAKCDGCHLSATVWTRVRGKSCAECHESPHDSLPADCAACHADGEPWAKGRIAPEEHAAAGFPLAAPHDKVSCEKCHAAGAPYAERFRPVAPDDCSSCHADPHGGQFPDRTCLECHARERFRPHTYLLARHDTFALEGAHSKADCNLCHARPREEEPRRFVGTARSCRLCHADPHGGQFGKSECAECHRQDRFLPATYTAARHDAWPLRNAHTAVACNLCHTKAEKEAPRRFDGTPKSCNACHESPHGTQFGRRACTDCHRDDATNFRIRPYQHASWPLSGAHATASCNDCHELLGGVRLYRGTPKECASCHADVHRGQFRVDGRTRCERCHTSTGAFAPVAIDHDRDTSFPLDGTHRKVSCAGCHKPAPQPDGTAVVQYRPLGKECKDCHGFSKRR